MNNVTFQEPQAFSGAAIDPTTAWTLLVVVAVLSTLVGVVFIVAIVWTCMVCSGRTDVVSHDWCNGRGDYGRRRGSRFPPTHRDMVEMGHIPSTNSILRNHQPAISQDSGVSRGLGLRLSCHPDQVPNVPAPRSWTPSPPYELTKPYSRSRLGMKSKSQAAMQPILSNDIADANFCHSLPVQQPSCPRCSQCGHQQETGGAAKASCCTYRSPFNPRQNSPASDAWSRGSVIRSPREGGIDNPTFEHSPNFHAEPTVQIHHHQQQTKNDLNDRLRDEHSPHFTPAIISPHVQDQTKQGEASKMQFGQFLDIPRKPMQRHRSRMFLPQPGSAGSNNAGNFIFTNEKNLDDTMDILLRNENQLQGPVACSSRQTSPQRAPQHQVYEANALSDYSASRSDPLVFQRKHYNTPNTPNNSLSGSLKDPMESQTPYQSPDPREEIATDPVSRHHATKALHPTPYDIKKVAGNKHLSRFKSQQVLRTPYAYQRALSEIQLPPSSEGRVAGHDVYVGSQNVREISQRNCMPWSGDLKLCMSCSTQGTLNKNLNGKERATQTSWSNNSTINNTQEMDPTPSMSWDHLTPDPSPVFGAQGESDDENMENYSQVLDDTTHIVGNSSKVFDDTDQLFDTSPQSKGNYSGVTANSSRSRNVSSRSRNVSSQTDPDASQVPQMSFRRNSTQIQPSISDLREMSSAVSPMVRGSPFIFVDSRIRVDSPQFVVDSTQLRVESPYHITDTPLSPFSESKSYGTTSIALRLAPSPLGQKIPLLSPDSVRNSSNSTINQNETHQNSGTYQLPPPAHFSPDETEYSHRARSNKQFSKNQSQNDHLHSESQISQRLIPSPTHCVEKTSSKILKKSPEKMQISSQSSRNTYKCKYESSPEVINADTLETLLPDDDN